MSHSKKNADNHMDNDHDDNQQGPYGIQLKQEFQQLGLLTQYLKPTRFRANHTSGSNGAGYLTAQSRKSYKMAKVKVQ